MATEAQIRANRENAKRSTGPRTEQGKAAVRFNALKHGCRSRATTMPVLPNEDPRELERHVRDYVESGQPRSEAERELLERAARLLWMLDQADRAESAHLARRVREARSATRPRDPRSSARVARLGRDLFTWSEKPDDRTGSSAVILAGLEESSDGRTWLLEQWAGFRSLVEGEVPFRAFDRYRFLRLLGHEPMDALTSLRANAVFQAWNALGPAAEGESFFAMARARSSVGDPIFLDALTWRELEPKPPTAQAARDFLLDVVDEQTEQLQAMEAGDQDDDCAAFDAGPQLALHRRNSIAQGRELLRILDTLRKLKKLSRGVVEVDHVDTPSLTSRDPEIPEIAPSEPIPAEAFPAVPVELTRTDSEFTGDNQSQFETCPVEGSDWHSYEPEVKLVLGHDETLGAFRAGSVSDGGSQVMKRPSLTGLLIYPLHTCMLGRIVLKLGIR